MLALNRFPADRRLVAALVLVSLVLIVLFVGVVGPALLHAVASLHVLSLSGAKDLAIVSHRP